MNLDIAIIDSGVNPHHSHVQKITGGHGYVENSKGQIEKTSDFMDQIGHGTAISGIIRQKAPFADLYAIKIFCRDLSAPAGCLVEALTWAINKSFKIIHLSLGVESEIIASELRSLCQKALDRNILILASARGPGDIIFPAFFPSVIGVYWDKDCGWNQMVFHPGSGIEFGAHGYPRAIPGMPVEENFKGSSFAVAHVTARVAQLAKHHPEKDFFWIKDQLVKAAKPYEKPVGQ